MDLISVIVPVYNVEEYLNRCVESIVRQTYKYLEIILVDDGSTDDCPQMCDEWKKKDKRVRVIHQANAGAGKARNKALDSVQGDFVVFVDSDDYIAPTMFEFLYKQFSKDVDIVECEYCITRDDDVVFDDYARSYVAKYYVAQEAMRENITDHIFRQLIWNKMYRKNIILNIRFPEGKKIDDEFWTYQVIGKARKLVYTDKVLYAYRQQGESVMHSLDSEKRFQAIEAKIQRHKYICERMPELEEESIFNLWFTCIYQGQLVLRTMKKIEQKNVWRQLEQTLQSHPIKEIKLSTFRGQKIWLKMASISFSGTCRVRNLLKIGL